MSPNRGYIVIPKLIEQPTWGGYYIAKTKGWSNMPWGKTKFGQSYELYSKSFLSLATNTTQEDFRPEITEPPSQIIPLSQLILPDAQSVLGMRNIDVFGKELKTLIKFTQAKGNSFQIHVKPGTEYTKWRAKPESWYYFEEGMATLGLSDLTKIEAYKQACITIDAYVKSLSTAVQAQKMEIEEARQKIQTFVNGQNIYQYVNMVTIPQEAVVNLDRGGTHHSWEEDDAKMPLGNVLYEVQVDEMDPISTIRSFDKGKIMDDGSTRDLQIDDYFNYIDTTPEGNTPQSFIGSAQQIARGEGYELQQLFDTQYYKLQRLDISAVFSNEYTAPHDQTFHHLFVKSGQIVYDDGQVELMVGTGHSVFVPASVVSYTLTPESRQATVLKTYV